MTDIENATTLPTLPPRAPDSNKGDFGRVLVVAGSRGMSGAAVLCGSAALRGGAGLVKVAAPQGVQAIVAGANPCYMTVPLPQDADGRLDFAALTEIFALEDGQDAVAVGPGLGRSAELSRLVPELVGKATRPIVLDADGLNAFLPDPEQLRGRAAPLVITPHPGEFARLLGTDTKDVQARRQELAVQFARDRGLVVVLKGHGTVVTDGRRCFVNTTGNPGLATGGTGDVLTGLIAALIAQGLEPFAAAQLGAHVHGLAGDLAREAVGEAGLIATDVIDALPAALREVRG